MDLFPGLCIVASCHRLLGLERQLSKAISQDTTGKILQSGCFCFFRPSSNRQKATSSRVSPSCGSARSNVSGCPPDQRPSLAHAFGCAPANLYRNPAGSFMFVKTRTGVQLKFLGTCRGIPDLERRHFFIPRIPRSPSRVVSAIRKLKTFERGEPRTDFKTLISAIQ